MIICIKLNLDEDFPKSTSLIILLTTCSRYAVKLSISQTYN